MFIIEPEIGEMGQAIGRIYFEKDKVYRYKVVRDIISDKKNDEYLVNNIWFPIYRIYQFSFGGIEIYNDKCDQNKIKRENDAYIKAHGDDPSGVYIWSIWSI